MENFEQIPSSSRKEESLDTNETITSSSSSSPPLILSEQVQNTQNPQPLEPLRYSSISTQTETSDDLKRQTSFAVKHLQELFTPPITSTIDQPRQSSNLQQAKGPRDQIELENLSNSSSILAYNPNMNSLADIIENSNRLQKSNEATIQSIAGDLHSTQRYPLNNLFQNQSDSESTVNSTLNQQSLYPFQHLKQKDHHSKTLQNTLSNLYKSNTTSEVTSPRTRVNVNDQDANFSNTHNAFIEKSLEYLNRFPFWVRFERWWKDQMHRKFKKPTILITLFMAFVAALVSSVISFTFYTVLNNVVYLVWVIIPHAIYGAQPPSDPTRMSSRVAYLLCVPTLLGFILGLSLKYLGYPGDLPDVVHKVHEKGYLSLKQIPSLFVDSILSISSGASLGPEAPILAACSATSGWISRYIFLQRKSNVIRGMTLMGMSSALAAFFQVPLGGSLFALEVLHRRGYEFYEFTAYCIVSGTLSYFFFILYLQSAVHPIWVFSDIPAGFPAQITFIHMLIAAAIGLIAVAFAFLFRTLHFTLKKALKPVFKLIPFNPVLKTTIGGLIIACIGGLLPPVFFFGEWGTDTIADSSKPLPYVYPVTGFWPYDNFYFNPVTNNWANTWWLLLIIALVKFLVISFSVHVEFRGGFIFPLLFCGMTLGKSLSVLVISHNALMVEYFPPILICACMAAGLLTSLIRTPIATTIIVSSLVASSTNKYEFAIIVPVMVSSFVGLFAAWKLKFIATQKSRHSDKFWRDADEEFWEGH